MGSAKGDAALLAAANSGDVARLVALLEEGASPGARSEDGWPALHVAASTGNVQIARHLLDSGADVDEVMITHTAVDRELYEGTATPLLTALRSGHEPVALLLLERGAQIEHEDAFSRENALYRASKLGFSLLVERLLAMAAPGECKAFGPMTPVCAAASGGHTGIVRRLLAAGLPVTSRAFVEACRRGDIELATLLLDSGADVNESDQTFSPLRSAASFGHVPMLEWLVARGADLRVEGPSALAIAASAGHTQAAHFFIQRGIDVNSRNGYAWTPLMSAAWQGKAETTQALLDAGADPTLTDGVGKTALDWARESYCRDAVPILEAWNR